MDGFARDFRLFLNSFQAENTLTIDENEAFVNPKCVHCDFWTSLVPKKSEKKKILGFEHSTNFRPSSWFCQRLPTTQRIGYTQLKFAYTFLRHSPPRMVGGARGQTEPPVQSLPNSSTCTYSPSDQSAQGSGLSGGDGWVFRPGRGRFWGLVLPSKIMFQTFFCLRRLYTR